MGAHYFVRDNELHYDIAASKDKDFVVIEGATHGDPAVHRLRDGRPASTSTASGTSSTTSSAGSTRGSELPAHGEGSSPHP